jgi:hypothetical protein
MIRLLFRMFKDSVGHRQVSLIFVFFLPEFCKFGNMKVNAEKRASISQIWPHSHPGKTDLDPNPFHIHTDFGYAEIPIEIISLSGNADWVQ